MHLVTGQRAETRFAFELVGRSVMVVEEEEKVVVVQILHHTFPVLLLNAPAKTTPPPEVCVNIAASSLVAPLAAASSADNLHNVTKCHGNAPAVANAAQRIEALASAISS